MDGRCNAKTEETRGTTTIIIMIIMTLAMRLLRSISVRLQQSVDGSFKVEHSLGADSEFSPMGNLEYRISQGSKDVSLARRRKMYPFSRLRPR